MLWTGYLSVGPGPSDRLAEGVDVEGGEDHEEGEGHDDDLEPLLEFATEDNGVEAALLENGSAVLMMMVMMLMFRH